MEDIDRGSSRQSVQRRADAGPQADEGDGGTCTDVESATRPHVTGPQAGEIFIPQGRRGPKVSDFGLPVALTATQA